MQEHGKTARLNPAPDRLRARLTEILAARPAPPSSSRRLHPPAQRLLRHELLDSAFEPPDQGTTSAAQLRELIERLEAMEHELSYHRRILHGRIAVLRAQFAEQLEAPDGQDV